MSPGWREVKLRVSDTSVDANHPRDSADNVDEHINLGLFGFFCTSTSSTDSNATPKNKADAEEYCKNWWKVSLIKSQKIFLYLEIEFYQLSDLALIRKEGSPNLHTAVD